MAHNEIKHVISKLYRLSKSAPRRNKEFSLGLLYTHNLMQQTHCAYSGRPFTDEDPSSFERIDNAVGYVEGNVIAVCTSLNSLRNSKTLLELETELVKATLALSVAKQSLPEPKKASTRKEKIKEMINHPSVKFDTIRCSISSITNNEKKIATAQAQMKRVEEAREKMNDSNHQETHYKLQQEIIGRAKIKIIAADKAIDDTISKRFTNGMINLPITTNDEEQAKIRSSILDLTDTIEGIKKFENLTRRQKLCVKYGIALDSSIKKLLKASVVYNFS